jgi:integrase
MSHLERRRNLWYATLVIPPDVRGQLGKFKFFKSLGTPDKQRAEALKAPLVAQWKAIIRRERGEVGAVEKEALRWRAALRGMLPAEHGTPESDNREAAEFVLLDHAEGIEDAHGSEAAQRFADIARGVTIPTSTHFEPWLAQLELAQKTMDQMRKDVAALIKRFPTLSGITHQSVKRWLDELEARQVSASSRDRMMSFCRNYWGYLQKLDAVPSDSLPFTRLAGNKARKQRSAGGSWEPLSAVNVVKLWKAARDKEDQHLADLIILGAYTGARIEELCSLKLEQVSAQSFKVEDAKTAAGVREVPIHTKLRPLVKRLKDASEDGYLLSGLTFNKYGDRSNAVGKRFGRLKASMGFSETQVFHSIRKTLVTLLENAGVSENLAADIVGHEKPRITYGLYSGGASLKVKAEAIERVAYPLGKLILM